jgi:hypothetical protein
MLFFVLFFLQHTRHDYKYINGYPDGEFKPETAITLAELAVILTRLLNKNTVKLANLHGPMMKRKGYPLYKLTLLKFRNKKRGYPIMGHPLYFH